MNLTKEDLLQISQLINQGFENLFMPYFDAKLDVLRGDLRKEIQEFKKDTQENFLIVHERIDEAICLIGNSSNASATKKQHKALEARVSRLEMAA